MAVTPYVSVGRGVGFGAVDASALDVGQGGEVKGSIDYGHHGDEAEEGEHELVDAYVGHWQACEHHAGDEVGGDGGADRVCRAADCEPLDGLGAADGAGREVGVDHYLEDGDRCAEDKRAGKEDEEAPLDACVAYGECRVGELDSEQRRGVEQGEAYDHDQEREQESAFISVARDPA